MVMTLSFFIGTLWGSFFYTLARRYISGEMEKQPLKALISSSRCESCGERIHPLFLVPLLGYLMLRGKCRKCGCRISPAYPLAEILYGMLCAAVIYRYGITAYAANVFLLCALAVSIAIIDLKTLTIPGPLVIAFIMLSIYPIIIHETLLDHLFGLALMGLFFLIIMLLFPGSFGGGDLKFASAIGLLMGIDFSILVLEISLISGAVIGIAYALKTGKGLRTKMAFGPFLTMGLIVTFLYGREILLIYYKIIN